MYTGLAGIFAASLDDSGAEPTYSDGFQVGEGMTTQIQPQYAEGSLNGDNRRVKYKKVFKNANVTLGVTTLPKNAQSVMFGRTAGKDGEVVSTSKDVSKYVGLGLYATEEDGSSDTEKYTAVWLFKVKFDDPGDDFETRGDNIVFKTPSLSGSAETLADGRWRVKKQFDTEAEAVTWLKTKAGMSVG